MEQANRSKLCKLQNKPGEIIYILYERRISPKNAIQDCAGVFDTKQDAKQVAKCLNDIFSKLDDKQWKLGPSSYNVSKVYVTKYKNDRYIYDSDSDSGSESDDPEIELKYEVSAVFIGITKHQSVKSERVTFISRSFQVLEQIRQERIASYIKYEEKEDERNGIKYDWKIIKYRTNDILPTMYFDDYHIKTHKKKFKHVLNELKDMPHAQANRRQLRRGAREKLFEYSDSSDSEDDTKYKRVTKRSLLHTPTRSKK